MADDWDTDFVDVTKPNPKAAARAAAPGQLPKSYNGLLKLCNDVGLRVRQCAEFHWQVIDPASGLPLVDFWPTTQKYRFNKAPTGQRARGGGGDAVVHDLDEYLTKFRGVRKAVAKPVASVESIGDPAPRMHSAEDMMMRLADRITGGFERCFDKLAEDMRKLTPLPPMQPLPPTLQPEWDTGADDGYGGLGGSIDRVEDEDPEPFDSQHIPAKPSRHSMSAMPAGDEWAATYWVALHALIMRADKLDPKAISEQASEFAEEAMTYKGIAGYE